MKNQVFINDKVDILVLSFNDHNKDELEIIAGTFGIFSKIDKISLISKTSNIITYYINRIIKTIFMHMYVPKNSPMYDWIFITGTEIFSKAIFKVYLRHNPNLNLSYYEDGMGSYDEVLCDNMKKNKYLFIRILLGFEINSRCKQLWVYEPGLVQTNYSHIEILRIPKLVYASKSYKLIKSVYLKYYNDKVCNIDTNLLIKNKDIIFFDSNWSDTDIANAQRSLVEQLSEKYHERLIVKPHPASFLDYSDYADIFDEGLSFEIASLLLNLKFKVCVTIFSTAAIVNNLIYEQNLKNTTIIFLYKIIKSKRDWTKNDIFIDKLRQKTNLRVFTPVNISELLDIIEKSL